MWAVAGSSAVIDPQLWADVADSTSMPVESLALAVDVSPDRTVGAVGLGGLRTDGRWHVELYEHKNGMGWIVPWIVDKCAHYSIRAVVIDGMSPAASLIDDLARAGVKVTTTSARDMATACGTFYDSVMDGRLAHTDQPQVNVALSVGRKRPIGDAWGWNRKNSDSDITPLVAVTLALWGAQNSNVKKPTRSTAKRRVVVLS